METKETRRNVGEEKKVVGEGVKSDQGGADRRVEWRMLITDWAVRFHMPTVHFWGSSAPKLQEKRDIFACGVQARWNATQPDDILTAALTEYMAAIISSAF